MSGGTGQHYPVKAIAHEALPSAPTAPPDITVQKMINQILSQAKTWDTLNYIYLTNGRGKPVGVISIKELLRAPKRKKLKDVAISEVVTVRQNTTKERAAMLAIRHDIKQLPVVSKNGKLLGVFDSDAVIDTLHRQHVEDILHFSGVSSVEGQIRSVLKAGIYRLVMMRAPWLIVGLAGGIISTFIISYFESSLAEIIALAFFIPIIVYMGDAVGHQTQLIFIRSLGNEEMNTKLYLFREVIVDLIFGLASAVLVAAMVILWLDSTEAALIIGITMFINIWKAGTIALGIPLLLFKLKKDPALGSGPFTTTVQDLLSIIVYFVIATIILN